MNSISVLLVDDHAIVREGTREILEREKDIVVVGEAANGKEAVELALELKPMVIAMDIAMPVMNGIEATRLIKKALPSVAVLVLTAYDDDPYIFALLRAGAAGYILKNAKADELIKAVRAVASGESMLYPSVAKKVIQEVCQRQETQSIQGTRDEISPDSRTASVLSEREMEVLQYVAKGASNKEIAAELFISPRTVQVHLYNVFCKMGVGSRTEAVFEGVKRGWIKID